MITYRDFVAAFRDLGLSNQSRVIAHASMSAFGQIAGGAETLVGALLASCEVVCMPSFTYQTMIIPPVGPPDNAIEYGSGEDRNRQAEIFTTQLRVDSTLGVVAETFRQHELSQRSNHPILSFSAVNAEAGLAAQTLEEPLAPIGWLADQDGDVLLIGVDHTVNTSLHYAEKLAGRRQFTRWALTRQGMVTCPGFPGCSKGFQAIGSRLQGVARKVQLGPGTIEYVPLRDLINVTTGWLRADPLAMLCDQQDCQRCQSVREIYPEAS
jgi:aminoglycoside 3-N-acetyltransferase